VEAVRLRVDLGVVQAEFLRRRAIEDRLRQRANPALPVLGIHVRFGATVGVFVLLHAGEAVVGCFALARSVPDRLQGVVPGGAPALGEDRVGVLYRLSLAHSLLDLTVIGVHRRLLVGWLWRFGFRVDRVHLDLQADGEVLVVEPPGSGPLADLLGLVGQAPVEFGGRIVGERAPNQVDQVFHWPSMCRGGN
jgi:hypothetical protein